MKMSYGKNNAEPLTLFLSLCLCLGAQFTEMYIKKEENITTLLSLLDEYDFHVRRPVVNLLTTLLT